jgi:hypothetical protein
MAQSTPLFIDIREAAALSGRHPNTIKRWGRAGKFEWNKPGGTRNAPWSIDRASFIEFMRNQQRQRSDPAKCDQRKAQDGILLVHACFPLNLPDLRQILPECDGHIVRFIGHAC